MINNIKQKIKLKHIICLVLSVIFISGIIVYSIRHFNLSFDKKTLKLEDFSIIGYDVYGNTLKSKNNDASLDYYNPWYFISDINISFQEPLNQETNVKIYYNTGEGYDEEHSYSIDLIKGQKSTGNIYLNKKVISIRIDLGDKEGQTFKLSNIDINHDKQITKEKNNYILKYLFDLLVLLIVFNLLILFIVKVNHIKMLSNIKKLLYNCFIKILSGVKKFFNKRNLIQISGGIIVVALGLIIELIIGNISLSKFNDKKDFIIDNNTAISNSITQQDGNIITTEDNTIIKFDLDNKYIKDLGIKIENGRGTPIKVKINGRIIKRKSVVDFDPYELIAQNNTVPVVYFVDKNVSDIEILVEDANVTLNQILVINHYSFNYARGVFISSILLISYCLFLIIKNKKINVETLFITISLIVGTLFAIVLPQTAGVSWDDQIHYANSARLFDSESDFLTVNEDYYLNFKVPTTYSLSEIEYVTDMVDNKDMTGNILKKSSNLYNQIAYIPSAIVLFVGEFINIPYNFVFILGRWINIIVFSIVVYFAIKKLKTGKVIMAIIALFPTAIFLAASYSYDPWVTAFTMLGMAYFLSELQQPDKLISTKECVIMIGAFVLGLGPKAIYFPLMFLLFFIKRSKFENNKIYNRYRLALSLSILVVIASFALPFLISGAGGDDIRGGADVNSAAQIKYILSSPFQYGITLIKFLIKYLAIDNYIYFISFFAYLGTTKYFYITLCLLIIAIFTDKNEYDVYSSTIKYRISVIITSLLSVVLISTALYVAYTPVGLDDIAGVQPRYLVPLLFPVYSMIGSYKIKNKIKINIKKSVYELSMLAVPAVILFLIIWDMCVKKYY